MRIAMISKAFVVAAYQRKPEELARLPGVELTVLAPPAWRDSRGETRLERRFTAGYQLVETPIAANGHFHTYFYPQLGQELARAAPDLVHVDEEPYNLAAWQAIRWAVQHNRPSLFFTWQNLYREYPPPFRWIERYSHRHAAWAIAGNREAAEVLRDKGFARPVTIIPQFGVDPQLFQPNPASSAAMRDAATQMVLGYAGGLVEEKGIDVLLDALAACNAVLGGQNLPPCHLALAGGGPLQPALQAQAQSLGLQQHVSFLGRIPSTDMPVFYNSVDVLVLPSRSRPNWKEQFGRVLVEAMACGVPVIGSDCGEIPAVIGNGGWVFAEGDAQALAGQLLHLVHHPELRRARGHLGRQRVLDHYTQEQVARATYQVYQAILAPS